MSYGVRRFKMTGDTPVMVVDALVEWWEGKGFDVEIHIDTRDLCPRIKPERKGWGGADFDPHAGSNGQRYGRD